MSGGAGDRNTGAPGRIGRRAFLAAGAAALAGFLPRRAAARPVGANDRLVLGHIGVGAHGLDLIRRSPHAIGALCDLDEARMRAGAAHAAPGVRLHRDYRALLEQGDLDGVVIATPDHWHVAQAVHAAEAGKAVYLAAPAIHRVGEAPALLAALARCPVALHVGLPAAGRLRADLSGLQDIIATAPPNPVGRGPARSGAIPADFDWARWFGPHPARSPDPDLLDGGWRWRIDLGGGRIVGGGAHAFAAILGAFPADGFAFRVAAQGRPPVDGPRDCPAALRADFELLPGGPAFRWEQRADAPDGVELRWESAGGAGALRDCAGAALPSDDPDASPADPLRDWADAVRAGETGPARARLACRAATLAHAANLSLTVGRPLVWREDAGAFDDDQANRLRVNPGWNAWIAA